MTVWLKLAVLGGAAALAFWAGWNWNGSRWEAKYAQFETDLAVNIQETEERVRQVVTDNYERRLAEELAISRQSEQIAAEQAEAITRLQGDLSTVRSDYEQALKSPACESWATQPIGCEFDEMEP